MIDAELVARAEFAHGCLYVWPGILAGPFPVVPGLDGLCECPACFGETALRRLARVVGVEAMFQMQGFADRA